VGCVHRGGFLESYDVPGAIAEDEERLWPRLLLDLGQKLRVPSHLKYVCHSQGGGAFHLSYLIEMPDRRAWCHGTPLKYICNPNASLADEVRL
jgi:hypothetical protein